MQWSWFHHTHYWQRRKDDGTNTTALSTTQLVSRPSWLVWGKPVLNTVSPIWLRAKRRRARVSQTKPMRGEPACDIGFNSKWTKLRVAAVRGESWKVRIFGLYVPISVLQPKMKIYQTKWRPDSGLLRTQVHSAVLHCAMFCVGALRQPLSLVALIWIQCCGTMELAEWKFIKGALYVYVYICILYIVPGHGAL